MIKQLTKYLIITLILIYPIISSGSTTKKLPDISDITKATSTQISESPTSTMLTNPLPDFLPPVYPDEDVEEIITNGPDYVPPPHQSQKFNIFKECADVYIAVIIYPSNVDWKKNPQLYKYNKAFSCQPDSALFSIEINLPPGEYLLLTADQGKRERWRNAVVQETFTIE